MMKMKVATPQAHQGYRNSGRLSGTLMTLELFGNLRQVRKPDVLTPQKGRAAASGGGGDY